MQYPVVYFLSNFLRCHYQASDALECHRNTENIAGFEALSGFNGNLILAPY